MGICCSEMILLGQPVLANIRTLSAFVPEVELMLDGAGWDDSGDNWERLAAALREIRVPFSVHPPAWDTNLTSQMRALREATFSLHLRALDLTIKSGSKQMVVHPGFCGCGAFDKEQCKIWAREYLDEMIKVARPAGVTLAFENVGYGGTSLYTMEEFIHELDDVDDCVQYLIDVGHAHCNGWDIPALIDILAPRLCSLHLHDNNGRNDQHRPICTGTIDWKPVFESISRLPESVSLILEYMPGIPVSKMAEGAEILRANIHRKS